MVTSDGCPFCVGNVFQISTRSLPESATNSRVPSDSANRGKFIVAPQRSGYTGFPARSVPFDTGHRAGVSLSVVSVELVAAVPLYALFGIDVTMSTCPSSRSAGWLFVVGILFQISTRLNPRSVTIRCVPSLDTETGVSIWFAAACSELFV